MDVNKLFPSIVLSNHRAIFWSYFSWYLSSFNIRLEGHEPSPNMSRIIHSLSSVHQPAPRLTDLSTPPAKMTIPNTVTKICFSSYSCSFYPHDTKTCFFAFFPPFLPLPAALSSASSAGCSAAADEEPPAGAVPQLKPVSRWP